MNPLEFLHNSNIKEVKLELYQAVSTSAQFHDQVNEMGTLLSSIIISR